MHLFKLKHTCGTFEAGTNGDTTKKASKAQQRWRRHAPKVLGQHADHEHKGGGERAVGGGGLGAADEGAGRHAVGAGSSQGLLERIQLSLDGLWSGE